MEFPEQVVEGSPRARLGERATGQIRGLQRYECIVAPRLLLRAIGRTPVALIRIRHRALTDRSELVLPATSIFLPAAGPATTTDATLIVQFRQDASQSLHIPAFVEAWDGVLPLGDQRAELPTADMVGRSAGDRVDLIDIGGSPAGHGSLGRSCRCVNPLQLAFRPRQQSRQWVLRTGHRNIAEVGFDGLDIVEWVGRGWKQRHAGLEFLIHLTQIIQLQARSACSALTRPDPRPVTRSHLDLSQAS